MTQLMASTLPARVKIMEVGPRDGLQNEPNAVSTDIKKELITRLVSTGVNWVEATSFVSPAAIPQLQDADQLFPMLTKQAGIHYPVLVPNEKGLSRAVAAGVKHIAIFLSASETFSEKNIRMSIPESLKVYEAITKAAKAQGIWVRGYISCVMGCPYEGDVDAQAVAILARAMNSWGVDEISLGDTIGVGTPLKFQHTISVVQEDFPIEQIAVHCHDTYGQGLANILAALSMGVAIVDSSVGGLGGCPYARGATGNVATEDVIYMLNGMGIETGVNLSLLCETGAWICETIGREYATKAGKAWIQRRIR
ncbi:MAG: hydroxymethylglutaryl-CoA lyase [Gammaproteobacteria bacterium]